MGAEIEASPAARVRPVQHLEITAAVALFVVAMPVLFLHAAFQPTIETSLGSTHVQLRLSDLAVLAIGVAAALGARRDGVAPLRQGKVVWAAAGGVLREPGWGAGGNHLSARDERGVSVADAPGDGGQVRGVRVDRGGRAARPAHAA